jgi:hypothetical protein
MRIARPPHLNSLHILTCVQRTRVHFYPQHWLLCHLDLYKLEFEFERRAVHFRSLLPIQQGCAALQSTFAGERHTKKESALQRPRHLIATSAFDSRTSPRRPAHISGASRAHTSALFSSRFYSRATHAHILLLSASASVPFGFALVGPPADLN